MTRQAENIDIQQDQVNQIANDLVVVSEGSQILGIIFWTEKGACISNMFSSYVLVIMSY